MNPPAATADARLVGALTATAPAVRDQPLEALVAGMDRAALSREVAALEAFYPRADNLYAKVRALFFLYAIHRFYLPPLLADEPPGLLPPEGHEHLLNRRFEEGLHRFREAVARDGLNDHLASGLAHGYYQLGLQYLADQVRASVRAVRGNQWMFRTGHPDDHPLRLRPELLAHPAPILHERTPVRMDLSHSGWSDIFFLGMDYPEGARVLNVSVDLTVDPTGEPRPPVEAALRVIDRPVLRLVSVDLGATVELNDLAGVFAFAADYLGLLKAALIAAGVVPIGMEGSGQSLERLLEQLVGPGRGLELVSCVNNIPKGSRLAVSTNLLAALIAVGMRATGQTESLTGPLTEREKRLVASRAILGEWLGGSGGGWQDSGGVWPGIKVIAGAAAGPDDPEHGVSRGRLLPTHTIIGEDRVSAASRQKLQESLVLVHGGMAQHVGPILEMVTEKYLLRSAAAWEARQQSRALFDAILGALEAGDIRELGRLTTEHFFGPLQAIIPWASNHFTEELIAAVRAQFGEAFWGFWMLGGMSGGGMGFIFDPAHTEAARAALPEIMGRLKRRLERALPFAMDPVVYRFALNEHGTVADLHTGRAAFFPAGYYPLVFPELLRRNPRDLSPQQREELARFGGDDGRFGGQAAAVLRNLFPPTPDGHDPSGTDDLDAILDRHGFDRVQHQQIRADLRAGRIGLAQNRLSANRLIEDVPPDELLHPADATEAATGAAALANGEVAVVTMAGGIGSRWTQGAGVVKALHPFHRFGGRHRNFLEVHLAKSRRTAAEHGAAPAHVITTSYLTHDAIAAWRDESDATAFPGPLALSPGRAIGLRLIPMVRDLRFVWEETAQQVLDERAQKVVESAHAALMEWAAAAGEGADYRDNHPAQCLHPVGHAYEVPNLLLNGVLRDLLAARPQLRTLLLHNVDTLGADLDPAVLAAHRAHGGALTFEVIGRRLDDRGGGLARVDGRTRLIEGLAMPDERTEYGLTWYNTGTTWVEIDPFLQLFGLTRANLDDPAKVATAVRGLLGRLPTYVTLKDVKKRWGHGQEDVFPVAQFEKLWGDFSALPGSGTRFVAVSRARGQQLKDPAQLDGWLRDGSAAYIEQLGAW